jgi:uncharacterized protein (DUF697 family)
MTEKKTILSTEEIENIENKEQIILLDKTRRKIKTRLLIIENVFWAIGAGAIPIPIFDLFFVTAIQLKLISDLSLEYNVKFSKNRGKAIIASLTAGTSTGLLANHFVKSIFKIHATPVAILSLAIFGGATTYAIGQVFVRHFESGGTLLNFDSTKYKEYFAQQFKEGKKVVTRAKNKKFKS